MIFFFGKKYYVYLFYFTAIWQILFWDDCAVEVWTEGFALFWKSVAVADDPSHAPNDGFVIEDDDEMRSYTSIAANNDLINQQEAAKQAGNIVQSEADAKQVVKGLNSQTNHILKLLCMLVKQSNL